MAVRIAAVAVAVIIAAVPVVLFAGGAVGLDRVVRDRLHMPMHQAVFGEVEGVDLDRRLFPVVDKADIAVGNHCLDLQMAVGGHDGHQHLRRSHHAAFGMHGELLHGAVDRRGQGLQPVLLRGLRQLILEACDLLFGVGKFFQDRMAVFVLRPAAAVLSAPPASPSASASLPCCTFSSC